MGYPLAYFAKHWWQYLVAWCPISHEEHWQWRLPKCCHQTNQNSVYLHCHLVQISCWFSCWSVYSAWKNRSHVLCWNINNWWSVLPGPVLHGIILYLKSLPFFHQVHLKLSVFAFNKFLFYVSIYATALSVQYVLNKQTSKILQHASLWFLNIIKSYPKTTVSLETSEHVIRPSPSPLYFFFLTLCTVSLSKPGQK